MSLGSAGSALSEPKYSQLLSSCSCVWKLQSSFVGQLGYSGQVIPVSERAPVPDGWNWYPIFLPASSLIIINSTIHIYTCSEQTISFPTVTVMNWITFHCNSVINLHSCLWSFQLPLALSCRETEWGFGNAFLYPDRGLGSRERMPDMDSASQRSSHAWHMWVHHEGQGAAGNCSSSLGKQCWSRDLMLCEWFMVTVTGDKDTVISGCNSYELHWKKWVLPILCMVLSILNGWVVFHQKDVFALCCRKKDDVGCQAERVWEPLEVEAMHLLIIRGWDVCICVCVCTYIRREVQIYHGFLSFHKH